MGEGLGVRVINLGVKVECAGVRVRGLRSGVWGVGCGRCETSTGAAGFGVGGVRRI